MRSTVILVAGAAASFGIAHIVASIAIIIQSLGLVLCALNVAVLVMSMREADGSEVICKLNGQLGRNVVAAVGVWFAGLALTVLAQCLIVLGIVVVAAASACAISGIWMHFKRRQPAFLWAEAHCNGEDEFALPSANDNSNIYGGMQ